MTDSPIQTALDYLYSFIDYERQGLRVKHHWDLRRVALLLEKVGNPHLQAKTIHIAGSKGKGSTAAMITSALVAAGYKTGLFTSPHLHNYNERIRVNGVQIPDEAIIRLIDKLRPIVTALNAEAVYGTLTTYEITTALGFMYFAENNVDFQVLEVGMGGRLDATNVISAPLACVITPVSMEHSEILGDTLSKIAAEKAGIIKPGCRVFVSPQAPEAIETITRTAYEQDSPVTLTGRDITGKFISQEGYSQLIEIESHNDKYRIKLPLLGRYQIDNAATAVAVLEWLNENGYNIDAKHIIEGLSKTDWGGRLQVLNKKPLVIADGSHNADSAKKLCEALRQYFSFEKAILIIGLSGDKDLSGIVSEMAKLFDMVIVTRSRHPRSMATQPIADEFQKHGFETTITNDITEALPLAMREANPADLICVTGSLFVAAAAIEQSAATGMEP